MTLWSRLRSWLDATFGRFRMESEMDAELRFHVQAYTDDLVRSGMPGQEAQRRAPSNSAPSSSPRKNVAKHVAPTSLLLSCRTYDSESACSASRGDLPW